jgi:hypothetical protein
LPIDRELERMRERKRRQVERRSDVTHDVKRQEAKDADDEHGVS